MSKKDIKLCGCNTKCVHERREIDISFEPFEIVSGRYYHKECLKAKQDIEEIKALWTKCINSGVVYGVLISTLNDLIYNRHIDSSYILFAIECAADPKYKDVKVNHPNGIRYLINNKTVKAEWERKQNQVKLAKLRQDRRKMEEPKESKQAEVKFTYNPITPKRGFSSIFGGDK